MRKIIFLFLSVSIVLLAEEEKPLSIWDYPRVWPRHVQLHQQFMSAMQRGDIGSLVDICRAGLDAIPCNPVWYYNLACALSLRNEADPALAALDKAIIHGFRNVDAISKDKDFENIKSNPRFAELLAKALALADKPVEGQPAATPLVVPAGGTVVFNETNLVFNLETGLYDSLLKLTPPKVPVSTLAEKYAATYPNSIEIPRVRAWLADGTASGNAGDIYINRDGGHSQLATADFPQITSVRYAPGARKLQLDICHPNTFVANAPVFGNISRGYTTGTFWRSLARHSFTEPGLATRMDLLYHSNQFWVIPSVNDYGKPELGDVFPANAPFQLVSLGASWTDQPFLRVALAASAVFRRPTKDAILKRRLMGPTIQWILRRTLKGVTSEEDYLSPKAHPTAFPEKRLNYTGVCDMAHNLQPEEIPPAVSLSIINSRLFPIHYPTPGTDYPDTVSELLFATPSAIAFILRAPEGERTFLVRAQPFPKGKGDASDVTYAWRVVNGDASAVKISAPLGEALNTPEHGFAQITIDRRALVNRIDVACFAKSKGTAFGAPSIISFSPLSQEVRVYRKDGKIESIDYTNPDDLYCDPVVALPRNWKDVYSYSDTGAPLGFTRESNGKTVASFTPKGERILERAADGTPTRVIRVRYTTRRTGDPIRPVELTFTDDGEPFDVKK